VKYLHRHPSELDLTIDQIAEVAVVGREIEASQTQAISAMLGGGA